MNTFTYRGKIYPEYLKHGGMSRYVLPIAQQFCQGYGFDIGAGDWPLPGAVPIDVKYDDGFTSMKLPDGFPDYIFSSHCLEHLVNPIEALEFWISRLKAGGVLFIYLPHPDMEYWRPQNCRKHLHQWRPNDMRKIFEDLGLTDVMASERDLAWGFSAVGWKRG